MKNILKSTSALGAMAVGAAALAGSPAGAAEPLKIGVSGEFKSVVGYADQDSSFENAVGNRYSTINMVNDSEVHFTGNTVLDNGIRVDVIIELEADQSSANDGNTTIDESYVKLTGKFGDLRLGSVTTAGDTLAHFAPVAGPIDHYDSSLESWVVNPNGTSSPEIQVGGDVTNKVVYFTPLIEGFQGGLSYTPSTDQGDSPVRTGGAGAEQYIHEYAVTFNRAFGGVDVGADVGLWKRGGGTDQDGWRVGGIVSYAGFTVGGSYADVENKVKPITAATAVTDYTAYDAGVSYATGALTVGLAYYHAESPVSSGQAGDDESTHYMLGATYNIGPGIDLQGALFNAEYANETTAAASNNEAWGVAAGIAIAF